MITLFYLFATVGLLLFIGYIFFYGATVLIAPFVNLYTSIKDKDYKLLGATTFFITTFMLLVYLL